MKKLDFSSVRKCEASSPHKAIDRIRPLFKTLTASALAFCMAGPMLAPKAVRGQEPTTQGQTKAMQLSMEEVKATVAEANKHKDGGSTDATYSVYLSDSTAVVLAIDKTPGEYAAPGEIGESVYIGVYKGQAGKGYRFSLAGFKEAYKEKTGQDLKYIRVGIEIGEDRRVGNYVQFYLFPVATKNGEITSGSTPIFMCNHATKLPEPTGGGEPIIIAAAL